MVPRTAVDMTPWITCVQKSHGAFDGAGVLARLAFRIKRFGTSAIREGSRTFSSSATMSAESFIGAIS